MSTQTRKKTKPLPSSTNHFEQDAEQKEAKKREVISTVLERCAKAQSPNGENAFSPHKLELAKWHLERAARDCETLDASEENQNDFFLNSFLLGIEAADSIGWIHGIVNYPIDGRTQRTLNAAAKHSQSRRMTALTLHHLRELVRDKFAPSDALAGIAAEIKVRLDVGDTDFFERLGEELKTMREHPEKYQRSIEAWIRRAWLPLCLWNFTSSKLAWHLIRRAAKLNQLQDLAESIDSNPSNWKAFDAAWRNVRVR